MDDAAATGDCVNRVEEVIAEGAVPSCVLLDLRYDLALRSDSILWKVLYENSILPYGENHYGSYLGHHTSLCNQTKIKGDKWKEM